jgi:hypothetical protein
VPRDWNYPNVEGVLYGLSGRPDVRVSASRMHAPIAPRIPDPERVPFPETVRRLDVALAVRRLGAEDRTVLERHYLMRARVSTGERRAAVKRLVILLRDLDRKP